MENNGFYRLVKMYYLPLVHGENIIDSQGLLCNIFCSYGDITYSEVGVNDTNEYFQNETDMNFIGKIKLVCHSSGGKLIVKLYDRY